MPGSRLNPQDVAAALGDFHASKVAAIVACGATRDEFEEACRLAETQAEMVPLGPVGAVYRILTADDELWSVGTDE